MHMCIHLQLHLYDVETQSRCSLLNYCSYVQWVPQSDVVVAQSRTNLCIWYNIDMPDKISMFQIKVHWWLQCVLDRGVASFQGVL